MVPESYSLLTDRCGGPAVVCRPCSPGDASPGGGKAVAQEQRVQKVPSQPEKKVWPQAHLLGSHQLLS